MFKDLFPIYLFCLNCICFISCKNTDKNKYIINSKSAKNAWEYEIRIDSIQIPVKQACSGPYFTYTQYRDHNIDYLLGYNPTLSTIDIFDLTRRCMHKQLSLVGESLSFTNLDKKDLDKSRSVADISIINFSSIILNYGNEKLIVIDTNLRKKLVISMDSISVKNNVLGKSISYSHDFKMFFDNNQLVLNQVYYDYDWNKKLPVFASLNMYSGKLAFLPISYSDYLYKIRGSVGFLTSIVTSEHQKQGLLTYSYLYESNIYQYNPKDSTITCYGGTPSKGKNLADSISYNKGEDPKKWITHNIENSQFFNVMYDKYRHVYYRFSLRNIAQENGKYFNSILDKPLVLMIFNEKFEVIREIELPMHKYSPNTWFITKEGLFISPTHRKSKYVDPLHLRFDIIKIIKSKS